MKLRMGLQARFLVLMGVAMLVVLALVALLLNRQEQMRREVEGVSRQAMRTMIGQSLRRQGEVAVTQLAAGLTNPLYYSDLDAVGALARSAQAAPDVRYVIVFDEDGKVVHDGSEDIAHYGRHMDDAMAKDVIAATALHTQFDDRVMDVSMPIMIGQQRVGGVRIGYDMQAMRRLQEQSVDKLRSRLDTLGQRHVIWIGLLGAGLLVFGALSLWLIQRLLVRPIRRLAESAQEIEAGHFDTTTTADGRNDEVGDLMRAFDRMSRSLARHDREIRRMAYTDALTGLANRLAFRESLDERLAQSDTRQLALLFADIDDFKRVNDTLGHDAGDDVLLECAHRIESAVARVGGEDALLARFGGDEFVILVQGTDDPHDDVRTLATKLAEALVVDLGAPVEVQGRQVFLGTSIGITLFPEDAASGTTLMKNGDIAMYQAKVAGKNCFRFYSRAMNQAVERRVHLEQELRGAWDRGELSLVYQPVFRLVDGAMIGAEALLRWRHPELGFVAPSVFIDVAEQSGLIEVLGPQVLHAACSDAVAWQKVRKDPEPLFVAVNVSPRQLRNGDLPNVVSACLRDTGLAADLLHLELTETAVIGDELHASALLSELRGMGVRVWLDDFGTGFSGLSHLRRVPVDGVKIDRSFVADVLRDPDDLALTTAIIAMAHSLGILVVAEGVEKEGQYAILRERGCDFAQGYWLGHPVTVDEFLQLRR
ncbi:putative bifunctional diguanylate cyclase/phosphodiesterase [Lysobacter auxotrophicus]|uniref:EAL domain-containing protein n=1 Tax=Lysobacter auxotrophicus TaxID=2992573 RepID=A0ABN6UM28_9GAMM|nr:EAL domain-containing protein [Lysobacter auxotrophicus]BDU17433.1 EAL domain-containing protein [Lysobacter auxotrophicus]